MWYFFKWSDYWLYKVIYAVMPFVLVLGAIFILDKILNPLVPLAIGIVMFIHMLSYFKRHEPKDKQENVIVKTKYHKLVEVYLILSSATGAYSIPRMVMVEDKCSGLDFIWDYWWLLLILFLVYPPISNLWRRLFFKFKTFGTIYMITGVISAIIFVVNVL
ncbi:MAG: hypothetical protein K2I80_06780 [Ruminococcus sp.]|nr:hypothetical protein [Ruminococcus sp.]